MELSIRGEDGPGVKVGDGRSNPPSGEDGMEKLLGD